MKFPLSWIRDFVQPSGSPADVAGTLTAVGLPVETVSLAPDGEAVAMRNITSGNRLRVRLASYKPAYFSDGTYQIAEWHEMR